MKYARSQCLLSPEHTIILVRTSLRKTSTSNGMAARELTAQISFLFCFYHRRLRYDVLLHTDSQCAFQQDGSSILGRAPLGQFGSRPGVGQIRPGAQLFSLIFSPLPADPRCACDSSGGTHQGQLPSPSFPSAVDRSYQGTMFL